MAQPSPNSGGIVYVTGSVNMDIVMSIPRAVAVGETLRGGDVRLFAGGKGANQACAAARTGASVRMIGNLGEDAFSASLRQSLDSFGVDHSSVSSTSRSTGTALITVFPDGANSILLSPGANDTVTPDAAIPHLESIDGRSVLLLQLEIPMETVEAAARLANERGAVVILDPAPVAPLSPELLKCVDILTPNQTEAAQLLGRPEWRIGSAEAAREAAKELMAMGPRAVIVKLGELGCLVHNSADTQYVPGYPVQAVDTTGAGDTFNGALAAGLQEGMDLFEAADFANAAAAISVTRHGAQASIPFRLEVEELRVGSPVRSAF